MINLVSEMISKKVMKMDVSGVRRMFELASKLKNPIDLTIGLPDFDVPSEVKEEAIKAIREGKNRYTKTAGIDELKEKIIKKYEKEKIDVKNEQIIITSAGSGALSIILTTIIEKDDEVLIFDPYFVSYKQLVIQNEGKPVFVNCNEDFSPDLEDLEKKITPKTKAIIINSPNNPTGKVYSENEMRKIAQIADKNKLLVISDEVYDEFCYDFPYFRISKIYKNTATINAFSKSHAMTGWRVGYLIARKDIVEQAIKVQQYNFVCAPTPFQHAALKAMDISIKNKIKEYKKKRDIIYEGLKNNYKFEKPEGAFYAFIEYPYDSEKFMKRCLDNELLVVPGNVFSERNTHFRISFATSDETLKKAVEVLNLISEEN
ncbi:MAG: aminotransferase class I/II-fold pyridoxal phosphate-dependent enzyme [archaeon]